MNLNTKNIIFVKRVNNKIIQIQIDTSKKLNERK